MFFSPQNFCFLAKRFCFHCKKNISCDKKKKFYHCIGKTFLGTRLFCLAERKRTLWKKCGKKKTVITVSRKHFLASANIAVSTSLKAFLREDFTDAGKWDNHGKNGFVTATKLGTTNKIFVAATKNFAAATKRFVDRTEHFEVVRKYFCCLYFNKWFCWYNKTFCSVRLWQ